MFHQKLLMPYYLINFLNRLYIVPTSWNYDIYSYIHFLNKKYHLVYNIFLQLFFYAVFHYMLHNLQNHLNKIFYIFFDKIYHFLLIQILNLKSLLPDEFLIFSLNHLIYMQILIVLPLKKVSKTFLFFQITPSHTKL